MRWQTAPEGATGCLLVGAIEVSVVIVTHQSADVLPGCLAALPDALAGVESSEVIVVDNASQDGSARLARQQHQGAVVIELGGNSGYAAGINAAMAIANPSAAVLVLNPDVRLGPGAVRHLLDNLRHPGTGITVPKLLSVDGHLATSLRREPTVLRALGEAVLGGGRAGRFSLLGELVISPSAYRHTHTADWATGAAMMMSRACVEAAGSPGPGGRGVYWDESFFLYSEETEFALRARDAGFSLRYVPEAEAVHIGGESATSPQLWSLLTRNRIKLYRRRHGPIRSAAFWLAVVLNEALRARSSATHRAALRALLRPGPSPQFGPEQNLQGDGYICFSAQDWWYHNQAHSDFQLMLQVARTRPVLLINSIAMRMPLPGRSTKFLRRIARKAASMAKLLRQPLPEVPGYWVMTPLIIPLYGIPVARAANAALVRFQVRVAARRLRITNPCIVVTVPTAWDVVRPMRRRTLVYNRSDKHSAFGEANQRYISQLESHLLRSADRILYVNHSLMESESELTGARAAFLDHGVDLDHFRVRTPDEEPTDLAAIPRPRIGFFGGLDDYTVDFDLLEQLARELPQAQLVLVGDAACSMARFQLLPNVHWLGFKHYADIPRYGSGFDVAIMPWLHNDWILHSNPIKLKEYLALGLPIVSTDFPELQPYEGLVRIAQDSGDFIKLVRQSLADGGPVTRADRQAAVADASWHRRAAQLIELCETSNG